MPDLTITAHAVQRYRERVADVPDDKIAAALSGRAFDATQDFGAHVVILPKGQRAIIKGHHIVTVLPKGVHVFTNGNRRDDL